MPQTKHAQATRLLKWKIVSDSQKHTIGPLPISAETTVEKCHNNYNGVIGGSVLHNA